MPHKVKTTRARVKGWNDVLHCEQLTGYGWRSVCDCGQESRVVASYAAARAWAAAHVKVREHD